MCFEQLNGHVVTRCTLFKWLAHVLFNIVPLLRRCPLQDNKYHLARFEEIMFF